MGFVIHLGKVLAETGFREIREEVYPFVKDSLRHPRVLMGLAIVMWFTAKVFNHFNNVQSHNYHADFVCCIFGSSYR